VITYHDQHASMLHLLGMDHTKLTFRFNGRNMRLTDVYGIESADRGLAKGLISRAKNLVSCPRNK